MQRKVGFCMQSGNKGDAVADQMPVKKVQKKKGSC